MHLNFLTVSSASVQYWYGLDAYIPGYAYIHTYVCEA